MSDHDLISQEIEEIDIVSKNPCPFDDIVGVIEDIIIGDDFQNIMKAFQENHWEEFEFGDENKLICYDTYHRYIETLEIFLENNLKKIIQNFSMSHFLNELRIRKSGDGGDVFDLLLTITDYSNFKEMMLDYRSDKEGNSIKIDDLITVKSLCNYNRPDGPSSQ